MQARLFPEGTVPEYTTAAWYSGRDSAPHVEEGAHRGRLDIAARLITEIDPLPASVVDLGCGDGGLLSLLGDLTPNQLLPRWGYDLMQSNVEASKKRDVDVRYGDIVAGFDDLEFGELAVTTEFLEHIVEPHQYVAKLSKKVKYLVASSPYTETEESHYGFHAWCWDEEGYKAMLEDNGFRVLRTELWSMFQVHLAEAV